MDSTDPWSLQYLQAALPPGFWQFLVEHVFHPHSTVQILKREASATFDRVTDAMQPIITPLLTRVITALSSSPDIVVLALVLAALFLFIQILNWMRRVLLFWTRLAFRAVFWATVIVLLAAVWQRGVETSLRDATVIFGKLLGYAAAVKDIWLEEYRKYESQASVHSHPQRTRSGRGR